ncbi:MAG: Uroporphyrinogen decarboxylase (URO-D) [bacterium ADurb.Bin429]|nr:MAG: Uroporphyrinogen decarboxylase (URO-D) [bacterium ADurb.Bin429]
MTMTHDIARAVAELEETLAAHPERRMDLAEAYVLRGELRPYPVIYLGRGPDISAGEVMERAEPTAPKPAEVNLLGAIRGMAWGLPMHNPIRPRLNLGKGTGTLPASFGIELDAGLGYTPKGSRPLADVLAEGMPDPETSGVIPEMRAMIEAAKALTPGWIEIGLPDMQGPFNIAHMILGEDAFLAPYEEPEQFTALMTRITDFFIAVRENLERWIGPERFPRFPGVIYRIAECSVNMLSPAMYLEHVLPHDRRIAEHFGQVAIHPCSGPHVFYATTRYLPNVVYQEAGFIEKTAAGAISVDDALAEIGDRPIILSIGQELPEDFDEAEAVVRRDLDRAKTNPRLLFAYTGMFWKKADTERIKALHLRLDDYWARTYRAGTAASAS